MTPGFAPAKVNLTLRVTGRRADGYHTLDSLVVFAGVGDEVTAVAADDLSLTVIGPEAGALAAEPDNLVLRAACALADATGVPRCAALTLTKRLPVASGIGGGSADAAAALRVLDALWATHVGAARLREIAATLGADVPVCIESRPARMTGVGDVLNEVPKLPTFGLLLANPRLALPTPAVFRARVGGFASPADPLPSFADLDVFVEWLRPLANDLQAAAITLLPPIGCARLHRGVAWLPTGADERVRRHLLRHLRNRS